MLLFVAVELAVCWFILERSSPWYAVGVVGGTFALGPAVAAPEVRFGDSKPLLSSTSSLPTNRDFGPTKGVIHCRAAKPIDSAPVRNER